MAKVLENEPAWVSRQSRHPWSQYFDGRVWELRKGEDFDTTIASFKQSAKQAAAKLGLTLKMTSTPDSVTLMAEPA